MSGVVAIAAFEEQVFLWMGVHVCCFYDFQCTHASSGQTVRQPVAKARHWPSAKVARNHEASARLPLGEANINLQPHFHNCTLYWLRALHSVLLDDSKRVSYVATNVFTAVLWLAFPACGVSWKCMARGKNNSNEDINSNSMRPNCQRQTKWPRISLHRVWIGAVAVMFTCSAYDCLQSSTFDFDQQSELIFTCRAFPFSLASLLIPPLTPLHLTLTPLHCSASCLSIVWPRQSGECADNRIAQSLPDHCVRARGVYSLPLPLHPHRLSFLPSDINQPRANRISVPTSTRKIAKKQIQTFSAQSVSLPLCHSDWQQADQQITEDRLTHRTASPPWIPCLPTTVLMEASRLSLRPASMSTTNPSSS